MSISSKSPRRVALVALQIARDRLNDYAHPFFPHKYTQPQLFACLVLKRRFKLDYRGITAILDDWPTLCQTLGLKQVTHYTTLQKAAQRLLTKPITQRLLCRTNQRLDGRRQSRRKVRLAAADSTGMEAEHCSAYFTKRRKQSGKTVIYSHFPKLALMVDTQTHMICSMLTTQGPKVDVQELEPLLDGCVGSVCLHHLLADAG